MLNALGLRTLFELILVIAVVWCIFHEDRLIAFEKRILCLIKRRRLRVVKPESRSYFVAKS